MLAVNHHRPSIVNNGACDSSVQGHVKASLENVRKRPTLAAEQATTDVAVALSACAKTAIFHVLGGL